MCRTSEAKQTDEWRLTVRRKERREKRVEIREKRVERREKRVERREKR